MPKVCKLSMGKQKLLGWVGTYRKRKWGDELWRQMEQNPIRLMDDQSAVYRNREMFAHHKRTILFL